MKKKNPKSAWLAKKRTARNQKRKLKVYDPNKSPFQTIDFSAGSKHKKHYGIHHVEGFMKKMGVTKEDLQKAADKKTEDMRDGMLAKKDWMGVGTGKAGSLQSDTITVAEAGKKESEGNISL